MWHSDDQFFAARGLRTPTWIFDIDTSRILHANAAACVLWHAETEADLRDRDLTEGMSATVAKRLRQYQADFIARDATFNEMWTLFPNGVPTSVMVLFRGFRLPDGRMAMQCEVFGKPEDEPDNLRSAEALLHTDVMITLYALDGPPLYMNPAARNIARAPSAPLLDLFVDRIDYDVLSFELEAGGEHRRIAKVATTQGERWFDISAKQCSDAATGDPAILVTAVDVSELKTARDHARYLASRDQLTGCYNRSFLPRHIAQLARSGAKTSALLYFDIDRFKQINDTFGHEAGDAVLKAMGERSQDLTTISDAVVRLGGDEFVVVIGEVEDDTLLPTVERLFHALGQPTQSGSINISNKVSVGIAVFDPRDQDVDAILRKADIALYLAKHRGRNQYVFYDDAMGTAAETRNRIEVEIDQALERREFVLHYQPRLDVRSSTVPSVEALARWHHPQRGLVAPGEFIPICEESGQIHALGKQVLEMAFAQAMDWQDSGRDIKMSINISPRQFSDAQFLELLSDYAGRSNFPAHKIELEITETVLIGDENDIASKLQAITDMGFEIAIDDFGTGYSNLAFISRFPLHCLKIDMSFIEQLPQSGPIVQLVLALGQQIGVTVVAEGVETAEQLEWLTQHGCDQVQGFYVAHPTPAQDLPAVLQGISKV